MRSVTACALSGILVLLTVTLGVSLGSEVFGWLTVVLAILCYNAGIMTMLGLAVASGARLISSCVPVSAHISPVTAFPSPFFPGAIDGVDDFLVVLRAFQRHDIAVVPLSAAFAKASASRRYWRESWKRKCCDWLWFGWLPQASSAHSDRH